VAPFINSVKVRRDFQKVVNTWSEKHTLAAADSLKSYVNPVLILWGDEDNKLFPMTLGKRLAEVFQQVEFYPVNGAMTYVQEDQADEFVRLLKVYLDINFKLEKKRAS
jgi:pimeloyl-ACP methyl ester carboxylesterase